VLLAPSATRVAFIHRRYAETAGGKDERQPAEAPRLKAMFVHVGSR
jgi:hypothetical protein